MRSNLGSKMSNGSHASCYRILYQLESLILPASACMPPDPSRPCQKEKKNDPSRPRETCASRAIICYTSVFCRVGLLGLGRELAYIWAFPHPVGKPGPTTQIILVIYSFNSCSVHSWGGALLDSHYGEKKMLLEVMYLRGGSQATTTTEATSSRALKRRD